MCLLIVLAGVYEDAPLVVAANRDERLDRPAVAMTVLRPDRPRTLGGRDEVAGGTWLAVNENGVVAGLTNRPSPEGRDATRRSRGELPLSLATHPTAEAAVGEVDSWSPRDYNEAWLLVGDGKSLFLVEVAGGDPAFVRQLPAGVHVLENRPLGEASPKVDRVLSLLVGVGALGRPERKARLRQVLRDHSVPDEPVDGRPPMAEAACVHGETYGTRSSTFVSVPAGGGLPDVAYCDGPPCTAEWRSAAGLWARP